MTTTWNPSDQTGGTLSNSNLTYAQGAGGGTTVQVRSTTANVSGKYYIEVTVGAVGGVSYWGPSLADAGVALASSQLITWGANGDVYYKLGIGGQTSKGTIATYTTGDVLCLAFDLAGNFYGRKNGGNWNNSGTCNPTTGAGALTFTPTSSMRLMQGINVNGGATANFTLNAGATSFAYAIPSGFSSWGAPAAVSATNGLWFHH